MRTIFIIFLCLINLSLEAQSFEEVARMEQLVPAKVHNHSKFSFAYQNKNEVQLVFSGLFLFYKTFISSQDGQSCSFKPSCSEFGLLAVKKKGGFLGILATFDRLSRCNGLSRDKYESDPQTGLLLDPP